MSRHKTDFTNVKCCICGKDKLTSKSALREYDKKGDWTRNWLCTNCYTRDYDHNRRLSNRRIGNIDPNSNYAKGDRFEELTCRWKGVKNLNIENDNYKMSVDHTPDIHGIIYQTRGKLYNSRYGYWFFGNFEMDWYKEFDIMICYCASEDGKIIMRIYEIPISEIIERKGMAIVKNIIYKSCGWYEKYRITDEETIKKVNEIWKSLGNY